ncbi:alpha/beta hydrolase [Anaeromicropila herbilytica]|uniref:Exported protein n=1 Tax=Anaeromicropila herbilytica TaxID=2785025 RepID=A0A7R7EIC7_9FIRM|nr:alpha/beta hydrolase [Anaeromicropila herbilytica]BCN29322.1 exported protein [Anaeromicropila herbilytica]
MMNIVVNVVLVIILFAIIAMLIVSWKLSSLVVAPKTSDPDKCYIDEIELGKIDKDNYERTYNREDFKVQSDYGYTLSGTYIPKNKDSSLKNQPDKVVIIVHGYTFCQYGSVKYVDIFRNLGFHCVIYDHRNHGYSDKATTTMGFYEAHDLKQISDWVREKLGADTIIGTHGESMGAATVMMNAALDEKLAFVIEDCGYSNLGDQLAYNMKKFYHLPRFPFLYMASVISKLRGGIYFHQVIPKNEIAKCEKIPMLFIHGEIDDFVPSYMVNEVYEAKKGYRSKKTFANATHAESYWNNQTEYRLEVEEFLKEINIL